MSHYTICIETRTCRIEDIKQTETDRLMPFQNITNKNGQNIMEKLFNVDNSKEQTPQQKIKKAQLMEEQKNINMDTPKEIEEGPNDDYFLFVKGNLKFEEVDDGKIKCGGCGKIFSRIVGHLTKNLDCARNIDLEEFKSIWSKFTSRRRQDQFRNKKITES